MDRALSLSHAPKNVGAEPNCFSRIPATPACGPARIAIVTTPFRTAVTVAQKRFSGPTTAHTVLPAALV